LKSKTLTRIAASAVAFAAICAFVAAIAPDNEQNPQAGNWYSVVPPILAIFLAFLTRRVLLSLAIAFVAGAVLTRVPQAPASAAAWFEGLKTAGAIANGTVKSKTNLQVLGFIPPIFAMTAVIIASGGFNGVLAWLSKWIKSRKSAQSATALMGILCFIDDYANAIIVGSMMQPVTDRFGVSREKLAFIVDATSAPISGLAFISTWIAYEVGLFGSIAGKLGIDKTGYSMFFDALSFRFYCVLMIVFVFVQTLTGRDFGPMRSAEESAKNSSPDVHAAGAKPLISGRAVNALLPLAGFIMFHIIGLWFDGGGPAKLAQGGSPLSWPYWREVISGASHTPLVLDCAAVFGLMLALLCGRVFGSMRLSLMARSLAQGLARALVPCAILILAWSLKGCCESLKTGEFLTTILAGRISPQWFPPIVFLVASVTSFATGTSYGTMAILMPTAIPIAFALDGDSYGLTTMISLGAILDGAIFGDHCSPISDTTIISSTASSCDLVQHVRTQLPYSILVAAVALLFAYLPSAFGLAPLSSIALAVVVMVCLFTALSRGGKATSLPM
jgi:Na+/H+ antiporter NhaC